MSLAIGIERLHLGNKTLVEQAISVLRKFGSNAHLYLPGVGRVSSLDSGNYLLSDGSSGYSPVDGLQGLCLDAMGAVGSELAVNPSFATGGSGWSVSAWVLSTGSVSATAIANGNLVYQSGIATAGNTYAVTYTVSAISGGGVAAYVNGAQGSTTRTTPGTYTDILLAPSTNAYCGVAAVGITTATITNISVKQVTGIHATSNGAARPTLRRGLTNLLTYSQDFSNAAWLKTNVTVSGSVLTATSITHNIAQTFTCTASTAYTFAFYAKRGTMTDMKYSAWNATGSADIVAPTSYYSQTNSAGDTLIVLSFTTPVGCVSARVYMLRDSGVTGDCTVTSAGLFLGTLTASQIISEGSIPLTTSAAASNSSAGRYSSQFAGAQSLTLGSVPWAASDDYFVIAGFRNDVLGAQDMGIASPASNTTTFAKAGAMFISTAGNLTARWTNDVPTDFSATTPNTLGSTTVGTVIKVGSTGYLRSNGVQRSTVDLTSLGTVTLNAGYIGKVGSSTSSGYPMASGIIGPSIYGKGTLTASEALTLERFVASLTPNAPSF